LLFQSRPAANARRADNLELLFGGGNGWDTSPNKATRYCGGLLVEVAPHGFLTQSRFAAPPQISAH